MFAIETDFSAVIFFTKESFFFKKKTLGAYTYLWPENFQTQLFWTTCAI